MPSIFTESENSDPALQSGVVAQGLEQLWENLAGVKASICFASPRGGVGKSTIAVNVAAALAIAGRKVAVLDADLNSPSIAAMLGVRHTYARLGADAIEPAAGPLGLRLISSDLLADRGPAPISFADAGQIDAQASNGAPPDELSYTDALCRLLSTARLGAIDMLIIDAATGLEHLCRIADLFPPCAFVLVSHPSELATAALRDAIEVVGKGGAALLGVIENMSGFYCASCRGARPLLPQGSIATAAQQAGLALLARLPFDPRLAESGDRGAPFVRECADLPLARSLRELAQRIEESIAALNRTRAPRPA